MISSSCSHVIASISAVLFLLVTLVYCYSILTSSVRSWPLFNCSTSDANLTASGNNSADVKKSHNGKPEETFMTVDEHLYVLGSEDRLAKMHDAGTDSEKLIPLTAGFRTRYMELLRHRVSGPPPKDFHLRTIRQPPSRHATIVDSRLAGRRNGFYVECGAYDGEYGSNTLFLETSRNWTGLLVEANPRLAYTVLTKNRQAYVYGGCLSPVSRPTAMKFKSASAQGGLERHLTPSLDSHIERYGHLESNSLTQCFPLADILSSIGVNRVDFLSLDVQGAEPAILSTIDFRQLPIDIIAVEVFDDDPVIRNALSDNLTIFFRETGLYRLVVKMPYDLIFERLDLKLY